MNILNAKEIIYNYCKEQIWITRDSEHIKYKDLDDVHLENTLKHVSRNIGPQMYSFETLLMLAIEAYRRNDKNKKL